MLFIVFCAFVVVFICFSGVCTLTLVQKKVMVYGYIRVSSDKQTVENQRFEIEKFCKVNNLHIDGWIEGLSFPKKSRFFSVYLFQDKTELDFS